MVQGYTCSACAGNLSLIEGKNIYRCSYCGKLFNDDMKLIDLKSAEKLRKERKNNLATDYLEELALTAPDDHVYKWELLNCSLTPNLLSDHIASAAYEPDKLLTLRHSRYYKNFHKDVPVDWKEYVTNVDSYISVSRKLAEKWCEYNTPGQIEVDEAFVERAAKKRKKLITLCVIIALLPFLVGLCIGSYYVFLIPAIVEEPLIVVMFFIVVEQERRNRNKIAEAVSLEQAEIDKDKAALKDELDDLRRQAMELMDLIRAKEQEILDLISR